MGIRWWRGRLSGSGIRGRRGVLARGMMPFLALWGCEAAELPEDQARRLVNGMDLRTRAAQVLVVDLGTPAASAAPAVAPAFGGIWVDRADPAQVAAAVRRLQTAAAIPLLVAGSVDGGAPLTGATRLPAAATIASVSQAADARVAGSVAAGEATAAGVRLGFVAIPPTNGSGPLAPAARRPDSTAAGLREFVEGAGESGMSVGVVAFWMEEGADPVLSWDRARFEAVEMSMLRPLIEAGVAAIAPGPVRLPSLTGDSTPLPLSPTVPRGLLRRQLGFEGVVAADLHADAPLAAAHGEAEAAVRAMAAGCHLLLRVRDPQAVAAALVAAVEDGRLPRAAIDSAAVHVVALRLRIAASASPPLDSVGFRRRAPAALALARRLDSLAAAPAVPAAPELRPAAAADAGVDPAKLAAVDTLLRKAIDDSVFTAAALAVGRRGSLVHLRGLGERVDPATTVFDVASLTKVLATTMAVGILIDRGEMELDEPVRTYLPEWRGDGKEDVTIRHLLTHTSGLPSGLWLFGSAGSPEQAMRQALAQSLIDEPGEEVVYSDLGMILLAGAIERIAGTTMDRFLALHVFAPLGMQHTMFIPPLALAAVTVPTAVTTERDFVLRGIVHDANAFRLGGVAGHAGLFSTARDLTVLAQMILNGGAYGDVRILSPATVASLTTRQPGAGARALGWDTPADLSSAGRFFSARSFGHTGYTGTSLWFDPDLDLFVVLLTNRTFTSATSADIRRLRAAVHEGVAQAVTDVTIRPRPGSREVR